jgi:thioredoxin reductase
MAQSLAVILGAGPVGLATAREYTKRADVQHPQALARAAEGG